jgi:hypothetical protein
VTLNSPIFREHSLLPAKNSLFPEIFSLLICVGNCAKSDCGAAVSCYEIGLGSPEIAKFPVKFPVSREFAWRRLRSALRRQPGRPAGRVFAQIYRETPAIGGLLCVRGESPGGGMGVRGDGNPESLRPTPQKFPFSGDSLRRPSSTTTATRAKGCTTHHSPAARGNIVTSRSELHYELRADFVTPPMACGEIRNQLLTVPRERCRRHFLIFCVIFQALDQTAEVMPIPLAARHLVQALRYGCQDSVCKKFASK